MRMKKLRAVSLMLALALSMGVLAGCGSSASSSTAASAAGSAAGSTAATNAKKDIVVVMPEDMETFDPVGSSARSTMAITKMMYTTLYVTDENSQPVAVLADSMDVLSDTEIQFTIHQGAKFSDGSEITTDDVIYNLERALASPNFSTLMKAVTGFEKVDDYTFKILTSGPAPSIQLALCHPGTSIVSKAYAEGAVASGDWSNPVCSGQYVLDHRTIGQEVKLVKNDQYFDEATAAANDSITFKYVPEASSRTIMVETGEADVNFQFAAADYNTVADNTALKLYQKTGTIVQYYGYDTTKAPFDNVKVRQAMCYAFDRDAIVQVVAEGLGTPAYSVLPPSTLGYNENPAGYTYDVEKAKALLTEAGYGDGFDIEICVYNDIGAAIAPVLQGYLAELKINATINRYESSVRMDMLANHQVPSFAMSWGAMSDADLVLPRLFTEEAIGAMNFTFYSNDELTALLDEARGTYDNDTRKGLYEKAVAKLAEDAPWCPLYIPDVFALTRADLQGVALDGEGIINLYALHY